MMRRVERLGYRKRNFSTRRRKNPVQPLEVFRIEHEIGSSRIFQYPFFVAALGN